MKNEQTLLLELLLIKARYNDNEIKKVIEILNTNPTNEILEKTLEALSQLAFPHIQDSRKGKKSSTLELLKQSNPHQYSIIFDFQKKLLGKEILAEPYELRNFATEIGLSVLDLKRREQIVRQVIEALTILPSDRAIEIIKQVLTTRSTRKNEFGILADAILQRDRDR